MEYVPKSDRLRELNPLDANEILSPNAVTNLI